MKVNLFVRGSFFIGGFSLFFFLPSVFAESNFVGSSPVELVQINKKLDASQKRKEQILANQKKILSEIEKSRKIAFNNRGRSSAV